MQSTGNFNFIAGVYNGLIHSKQPLHHTPCLKRFAETFFALLTHALRESLISKQGFYGMSQQIGPSGRREQSGYAIKDEFIDRSHIQRHDGFTVRHCFGVYNAERLFPRRNAEEAAIFKEPVFYRIFNLAIIDNAAVVVRENFSGSGNDQVR